MQKIIIIAILFALAYSAQVDVSPGTAAGFSVVMGVAHACHISCLTCDGPANNNCLTCPGTPAIVLTAGVCGCTGTGLEVLTGTTAPLLKCEATATGSADGPKCTANAGYWFSTDKCAQCPDDIKTCNATAGTTAVTCWAGQGKTGNLCTYAVTTSYVAGSDTPHDQTGATKSVVNGYFYEATGHIQKPCNSGCLTCDLTTGQTAVLCETCATNYSLVGTAKTACECSSTGHVAVAAGAATLGECTKCSTGCITCTSATVCTACDSSSYATGTSTGSSDECILITTSDTATTTGTSTDGEKDGESSAATGTDATTTNGVLITAVSMLLAVILA